MRQLVPFFFLTGFLSATATCCHAQAGDLVELSQLLNHHCSECHSGKESEGGLDLLPKIDALKTGRTLHAEELDNWVKIHDRVQAGEMPPKGGLVADLKTKFVGAIGPELMQLDLHVVESQGRAVRRRINRFEYENRMRDLLHAPWLQLASILPEDGERYRFNKSGEALDVSHVNLARYMQAAELALREVMARETTRPESKIVRYYARDQKSFNRKVHYTVFNRSAERATFPLLGYDADLKVLQDPKQPFSVGDSDPAQRELEAFGVVASSYEPIEIRFSSFTAPRAGRYKLRFKGYTFWAEVEDQKRFRANREKTSRGRRSEPLVVYSQLPPRQLRRLGEFDFQIEPTVQELDVWLLEGESIQPDAVRLFRSRPPNWRNPLAEDDGMPGVAFNWMEVEGPIIDQWPSPGHQLLFDDLPLRQDGDRITVESTEPLRDASRLLSRFMQVAYGRAASDEDQARFMQVVESALQADLSFTDAMIGGYTAVLCSPNFLCLDERPGALTDSAVAERLGLFLWNSTPDDELRRLAEAGELRSPSILRQQVHRMLNDNSARQFINAFLAYWLDLRKINDTSPDELLYPDYYLDDSLVDAALEETQLFFAELIRENLPARNLIDSDFTFVNERLAKHYDLPTTEGTKLRRIQLPADSLRGGLLTQASVLKVTANGTTTSPVVRGAWVNERLLGVRIPPPPASVPAIEPDTRGATTIRQQLELHRADAGCNSCHKLIDPAGFALEAFDVAGGYRDVYRVFGQGEPIKGFGKNGQPFTFVRGPKVDSSGILPDGRKFDNIMELKQRLLEDERAIARNLVERLITYATGAAPRFSDRPVVEAILDHTADKGYPVGSLIAEITASRLFLQK